MEPSRNPEAEVSFNIAPLASPWDPIAGARLSQAVLRSSRADPAYSSDEILGFSETGTRHASVLLIAERDAVAGGLLDLVGRGITSHRELPNLGRHARYRRHRQFPFPGFADPSLLRNLLHIAGTLAG